MLLFLAWATIALLGTFWVAMSAVRYKDLLQPAPPGLAKGVLDVWRFWIDLYLSKRIPVQSSEDLTYALDVRRRLRLGFAGLIVWYASGFPVVTNLT